MQKKSAQFDLYTFVAGAALEAGKPFPLECNCGGVVTIMPPFRFCTVLKDVANREGIKFGFVVGLQQEGELMADPDEVERTIDLMAD